MQPFSYTPLDRNWNEIRLLRLHPPNDDSTAIVGHIEHVSLDADPQYEALSYTWGDEGRTHPITLSGSTFAVTDNLFSALCALRLSNSDRLLWIDAICINQEDISERNQEVLRMLSIYRNAAQVVVWLGHETDDTALAIDHLCRLTEGWESEHDGSIVARVKRVSNSIFIRYLAVMQTLVDNIRSRSLMMTLAVIYAFLFTPAPSGIVSLLLRIIRAWSFIAIGFRSVRVYVSTVDSIIDDASMPDPKHVKALGNLFSSPWFGRVWIVQEIAAARAATLLCGTTAISWRDFSRACDQIQSLIARSSVRNTYVDCGFEHIRVVQSAFDPNRPSDERAQVKWRMLFLLAKFGNFDATDPRDKIYGLLGLARESQEQDEESARMVPDYNKPLATIFAEVVMFVVKRMDSLDILRACEGFHRMPGLPSWAPDWTCYVQRTIGPASSRTLSYRLRSDPTPEEPVARFLDVPLTMTVRGFEIGLLVDGGKLLFTVPDPQFSEKMRAKTFGFVDFIFKYVIPYFEVIVKSGLFRLCLRTPLKVTIWFLPETKDGLEPYFGLIDDIVKDAKSTSGGHDEESISRVTENIFRFFVDPRLEPMHLLSIAWKPSLKRVTMDPGHCHAYVKDPRPGDLVCMFIGAAEPHIVRKNGQHYRLLNTATFGPFNRTLWIDCEREYAEGTLPLRDFNLR